MNHFPPELRTLAFVPRWCIVMTTAKDNVATHSYFVAVYSFIVSNIIEWKGPRDYLMLNALLHDNDESITGDITGTIKDHIVDQDRAGPLLETLTDERMEGLIQTYYDMEDGISPGLIEEADKIVKVADKLDGLLFLIVNQRMGNSMLGEVITDSTRRIEAAWRRLPAPKDLLDRAWQTTMLPNIAAHYHKGGRGCAPGAKI